jgi:hypothetical protein
MTSSNSEQISIEEKVLYDSEQCKISVIDGAVIKLVQKGEAVDKGEDESFDPGCAIWSLKQLSHADTNSSVFAIYFYKEGVKRRHCLLVEKNSACYESMVDAVVQLKLLQTKL